MKKEEKVIFLSISWMQGALLTHFGLPMLPEEFHLIWILYLVWIFMAVPAIFVFVAKEEKKCPLKK